MSGHDTAQQSPISPPGTEDKSSPAKRKGEDAGGPQPRAKRNRYISIACNECKRRKIKCNGETPCQRCGNLSLDCVYAPNCCSNGFKDSDEYRQMSQDLQTLQDQVHTLFVSLSDIQTKGTADDGGALPTAAAAVVDPSFAFQGPLSARRASEHHAHPPNRAYSGPASSTFFLDQTPAVNGSHLRSLEEETSLLQPKPVLSSSASATDVGAHTVSVLKDPLWAMSLDEALRLCRVYTEKIGAVYPIVDVDKATSKARTMFNFLDSMRRVGLMKKESERGDSFCDNETLILKMMLALAALGENYADSSLSQSLFDNVRRIINSEDRMGAPATILGLQLSVLVTFYLFRTGTELQAYRAIGLAARQCFELGLHRSDLVASMFETPEQVRDAIRLFWIIYSFDKRFSFSIGLPFAVRDEDIDPHLPPPDDTFAFSKAMLGYYKIAARVWTPVAGFETAGMLLKMDDMSWIDWQISQWQNGIPEELRFTHLDFSLTSDAMGRTQKLLRVLLYIRANQLRLQLYRPVFFTSASAMENRGYAQTVVEIAKDNIRTLSELEKGSDLYVAEQRSVHYYLVSAIGVLFLSAAQAPVEFGRQVRDEFYLGLELIKAATSASAPLDRLATTIRTLKKMAPGHALTNGSGGGDPHAASAAVAMAGLATGHLGLDPYAAASAPSMTGPQMSYELMHLFELACGYGDAMLSKHQAMLMNGMDAGTSGGLDSFAALWRSNGGDDLEFAKAMKDVF